MTAAALPPHQDALPRSHLSQRISRRRRAARSSGQRRRWTWPKVRGSAGPRAAAAIGRVVRFCDDCRRMGSMMSGRYPVSAAPLAEDLAAVAVRDLGPLLRPMDGACPVAASFDLGGRRWRVIVTQTPVFGHAVRHWFQCPRCGRRAGRLFLFDAHLACRRCEGVRYASQRWTLHERAEHRAARMWKRLAPTVAFTLAPRAPPRAARAHRRRHTRLAIAYEAAWQTRDAALRQIARRLRRAYMRLCLGGTAST